MTFITSSSLAPLTGTLHSLDLSGNLFNEIPDSLATLTNLRALNLSNCMIAGLHSLSRNPLPAINIINLRSNRLSSLAGIERLFSLEKIDLRDNRLADPTELARLTRIPDVQQIYVAKNPFVRTHPNYRVTIFNLFRSSPGYTEDVIIDGTGPTYNERRQLIDRVPEPEGVTIIRPPPELEAPAPETSDPNPVTEPSPSAEQTSQANATAEQDRYNASQRRRKGTRRRIVELSQDLTSPPRVQRSPEHGRDMDVPTAKLGSNLATQSDRSDDQTAQTKIDTPRLSSFDDRPVLPSPSQPAPPEQVNDNSPVNELEELGAHGDVYRQKIEALKNDLGNGWLTALSEDKWERQTDRDRSYSPARTVRPARTESRGVSVGARTLG